MKKKKKFLEILDPLESIQELEILVPLSSSHSTFKLDQAKRTIRTFLEKLNQVFRGDVTLCFVDQFVVMGSNPYSFFQL